MNLLGDLSAKSKAVPIYRGREVTGFVQDDTGVDVDLGDGAPIARYRASCKGA
jgi:hypothetical protein